jgi:hypothetical protein
MPSAPSCEASLGGSAVAGGFAERPFVALEAESGGVGATLERMRFYEPQTLRARPGAIEIDLVADRQRLGPFMGAFARVALTVGGAGTNWAAVGSRALARLDHPVAAWPPRGDVARSGVLDELWDGAPDPDAARYWEQVTAITNRTLSGYVECGMYGFMTYGLPLRYWSGSPTGYNEFGDETDQWDGYYFQGTFTDYHNALSNVVRLFAQTGEPELLSGLSFPGARRMLHTQIVQADPSNFYGGWGPIAYGGYRKDLNSSHSYFENLYAYYYLTGDRRVLDVLGPAGENLRSVTTRDETGALVPSDEPPRSDWVFTVDRASSQQATIYWFLGHASADASFLDDFRNQVERGVEVYSALLDEGGREYAFAWEKPTDKTSATSAVTTQMWMWSLYYLQNVWSLYREYGDVSLGKSGVTVSRYLTAVGRTLWDYAATVAPGGDGTPAGDWATVLDVSWSGPALGGTLGTVAWSTDPVRAPEPLLWFSGKSTLPALLFRAARLGRDPESYARAAGLTRHLVSTADVTDLPWGKEAALRYTRLHGAIGYLVGGLDAGQ